MQLSYDLRRTNRRSLAVEVNAQGQVIVRAPIFLPQAEIEAFLQKKEAWVLKNVSKMRAKPSAKALKDSEINGLKQSAAQYIPLRVEYFSKIMGVKPRSVKITSAQKRFGSCSGQNGLCFAWRLMLYPPEAIDYVVVHELAHILHHNHSKAFYKCIEKYMPDYKSRATLLK